MTKRLHLDRLQIDHLSVGDFLQDKREQIDPIEVRNHIDRLKELNYLVSLKKKIQGKEKFVLRLNNPLPLKKDYLKANKSVPLKELFWSSLNAKV